MEDVAPSKPGESPAKPRTIVLQTAWDWSLATSPAVQPQLEAALADRITTQRWFGAKTRAIHALRIVEAIAIGHDARDLIVEVEFHTGPSETYQLVLSFASGDNARRLTASGASAIWAHVRLPDEREAAVLYDPLGDAQFCATLLGLFDSQCHLPAMQGEAVAGQSGAFQKLRGDTSASLPSKLVDAEQSNSSVMFDERLILKIFRRVEMGLSPDLEVTAFLTEHGFEHVAALAGALEYRRVGHEPWTLAVLQQFMPNRGDAWRYMLGRLEEFLRHALEHPPDRASDLPSVGDGLGGAARRPIPPDARAVFHRFLPDAEILGKRTGELHLALSSDASSEAFSPEPFSDSDRHWFCERAGELARETFRLLREQLPRLPGEVADRAASVLGLEKVLDQRIERAASAPVSVAKIRCHGDFHLGQVLVADGDFVIIDFEGEPARPLAERRRKQLALRDVAGMIRSLHYASRSAVANTKSLGGTDAGWLQSLAQAWYFWMSARFLSAYQKTAAGAVFVPKSDCEFDRLLDLCLLEKAIYELRYELNNRPSWVYLPIEALQELLSGAAPDA
jgi:trehalose synthase-fused probable maltokinase